MIAWLLARPRLIAYGIGGLAAAGALWWVAHQVIQWREAYQERPALVRQAKEAEARGEALAESARLTGIVMATAEERILSVGDKAAKVRQAYREAVRTDPTCAEWAAMPVACPLGAQ